MTLRDERAFEELYLRLARWSAEAAESINAGIAAAPEIDRCVTLLGHMSSLIDVSRNYETAAAILSLNRFAIGALVRAKSEHRGEPLRGLPQVFLSLSDIFAAIDSRRARTAAAP